MLFRSITLYQHQSLLRLMLEGLGDSHDESGCLGVLRGGLSCGGPRPHPVIASDVAGDPLRLLVQTRDGFGSPSRAMSAPGTGTALGHLYS